MTFVRGCGDFSMNLFVKVAEKILDFLSRIGFYEWRR